MNILSAFGQSSYVSAIANAIQILSGAAGVLAWYHLSCAHSPWCLRHGRVRHGSKHYCAKHHPDLKAED